MSFSILPLGDSAIIVDFGNVISQEVNRKVLLLTQAIKKANLATIKDVVPAYSSVAIHYNVIAILKEHPNKSAFDFMSDFIRTLLSQAGEEIVVQPRNIKVPVCYSLKYGVDLSSISNHTKCTVSEIVSIHTAEKYKVYMIGFLPGFAYMGDVDERIAVPRKPEPRQKIEAGCVGIAGRQTGIYPFASPGGWQIIGRTPIKLFDKELETPVFFKAGDEVTFYSITEDEFNSY